MVLGSRLLSQYERLPECYESADSSQKQKRRFVSQGLRWGCTTPLNVSRKSPIGKEGSVRLWVQRITSLCLLLTSNGTHCACRLWREWCGLLLLHLYQRRRKSF